MKLSFQLNHSFIDNADVDSIGLRFLRTDRKESSCQLHKVIIIFSFKTRYRLDPNVVVTRHWPYSSILIITSRHRQCNNNIICRACQTRHDTTRSISLLNIALIAAVVTIPKIASSGRVLTFNIISHSQRSIRRIARCCSWSRYQSRVFVNDVFLLPFASL